jgi:hypothetical protein
VICKSDGDVEHIEALLQQNVEDNAAQIEALLEEKLGLDNDQTFVQAVNAAFEEKLKIGENQSVDLPKMERRVDNFFAVAPAAVMHSLRTPVVGKGTITEGSAVRNGGDLWSSFYSLSILSGSSPQ